MNLFIEELIVEVTRRCQLQCAHCLRGPAKNLDINTNYIDSILDQVDEIGTITFTGGEPSLNTEAIQYTLDAAKERGIPIGNFYVATNAHHISDEFLLTMMRFWNYCHDNEISVVHWSNDPYHDYESDQEGAQRLKALSFAHPRNPESYNPHPEHLIGEGNWEGMSERTPEEEVDYVYLSADGWIIKGCDWSYENQENHRLCKVSEYAMEWST